MGGLKGATKVEVEGELPAKEGRVRVDELENEFDDKGRKIFREEPGGKGGWNKNLNSELEPNSVYLIGNYRYETDELGRVYLVSGELEFKTSDRNKHQQTTSVKKKDGKEGDEGGHIVSVLYNGPGEQINYWPQAGPTVNKGQWRRVENYCKGEILDGKDVNVVLEAIYEGVSKRPDRFKAVIKAKGADGKVTTRRFEIDNV
jgi:hypothetical protein